MSTDQMDLINDTLSQLSYQLGVVVSADTLDDLTHLVAERMAS